jgi:NAD(P)-dependent dehydrogenase (short-subunit alcohol dehydrogenase family)
MNEAQNGTPLYGQVAVVTGGARGIGAAIARHLGALGAHVFLTARESSLLDSVCDSILEAGGAATAKPCDLVDEDAIAALAETVQEQAKRCDVLVNCAGTGVFGKPLHELAPAEWDNVLNVNLRAPYLMIRAFAPMMITAGYGHIVNISSLAGKNPLPNGAAYSASKWGLNGLTYSVAEELRPYNIRVSVVAPGSVNTCFGGVSAEAAAKSARKIQPEDVACVVGTIVTQAPQSFISEVLMRPTAKP